MPAINAGTELNKKKSPKLNGTKQQHEDEKRNMRKSLNFRGFDGTMDKIYFLETALAKNFLQKSKRVLSDIPYDKIGTEEKP